MDKIWGIFDTPPFIIFSIYKEIRKQKFFHKNFRSDPMFFTLFVVVFIFGLFQSVRFITNVTDAYVYYTYFDCINNNDENDASNGRSSNLGIPPWSYILHVVTRVLLVLNRYL